MKKQSDYFRFLTMVCLSVCTVGQSVYAQDTKKDMGSDDTSIAVHDTITIIGGYDKRDDITGSASIVSPQILERYQSSDIHRALRSVTGVNIREEDGYGLRPNISIRGSRANRSSDITVLEDGILATSAPYSAPEAYYFPQMERMKSLEVLKGVGSIKYGPRTTSGVLNMVTKPIPDGKQADFITSVGTDNAFRTGITTGTSVENGGVLLNAFHKQSDGFKKIDHDNQSTGYNVDDIMGKIRLNTSQGAERYQEIELKVGYYNENSDETYLGLTDSDFANNPHRRYGASALDNMDAISRQYAVSHFAEITPNLGLTTTLYQNELDRSWYRLASVSVGGVSKDIGSLFDGNISNDAYINALKSSNTTGDTFNIRNNSRSYVARGIQTAANYNYAIGRSENTLDVGVRYHTDEEDRFQNADKFDMVGGTPIINSRGALGDAGNRVQSAQAISGFIKNETIIGDWTLTPGVRFEHINLKREDYGTGNPNRTATGLVTAENDVNAFIPGMGVGYNINQDWKILGGVHKGFAPPGVPADALEAAFSKPEESINYELGTRYKKGDLSTELFGFYVDYQNLLGRDTLSSGGAGTGNTFNAGSAVVKGIEASAEYNIAPVVNISDDWRLPVGAGYTFTKGEFKENFNSSFGEWGNVKSGDELPYLAAHKLYLTTGVEYDDFGISIAGNYISDMRSKAGSGSVPSNQKIDAHWVFDVAGEYYINDNISSFVTVNNVFDETYTASRSPAGLRSGLPLTAMVGVKIKTW
jgi:Fe(3+) dicitrate transport protein